MEELVNLLIQNGKTISTMESCTGGAIANEITNIINASKVIKFSAVTYSNEYKIKMGVNKSLINRYSVYSTEVARDMAKVITKYANSDYGIGVTGKLKRVDENNPYGYDDLVYLSIYDKENNEYIDSIIKLQFDKRSDNKKQIIDEFVNKMLIILKK